MRPYKSNEASYIRRELACLVGVLAVIGAARAAQADYLRVVCAEIETSGEE